MQDMVFTKYGYIYLNLISCLKQINARLLHISQEKHTSICKAINMFIFPPNELNINNLYSVKVLKRFPPILSFILKERKIM